MIRDPGDKFVVDGSIVAYCDEFGEDFKPIILMPDKEPKPPDPDFIAYRIVMNPEGDVCLLYEVYWRRQDCTWRELNKDHEHDYEQIQIHFDSNTGEIICVVIASIGPFDCAYHGVEVWSDVVKADKKRVDYVTSSKQVFPWGGKEGKEWFTEVIVVPLNDLAFDGKRPVVKIITCFNAFTGMKAWRPVDDALETEITLERLDRDLLERWYFRNMSNQYGRDISKPFDEPYLMYYPSPKNWFTRFVYRLLWSLRSRLR